MNNDDPLDMKSGYQYHGEERDLHLRTYTELQAMNNHLRDLKLIGVLLIATVAFPPIAWLLLVVAGLVAVSSFLGKSLASLFNKARRSSNQEMHRTQ
jgi:hypothetical protein